MRTPATTASVEGMLMRSSAVTSSHTMTVMPVTTATTPMMMRDGLIRRSAMLGSKIVRSRMTAMESGRLASSTMRAIGCRDEEYVRRSHCRVAASATSDDQKTMTPVNGTGALRHSFVRRDGRLRMNVESCVFIDHEQLRKDIVERVDRCRKVAVSRVVRRSLKNA